MGYQTYLEQEDEIDEDMDDESFYPIPYSRPRSSMDILRRIKEIHYSELLGFVEEGSVEKETDGAYRRSTAHPVSLS